MLIQDKNGFWDDPQGVVARRHLNEGHTTDGADPLAVAELARRILRPLRDRAKGCGYALTEHGSRARDIDLVAIPWTVEATSADHLAEILRCTLNGMYRITLEVAPGEGPPKPHGRLCWSFWIRPWTYVDLSVMPRLAAG